MNNIIKNLTSNPEPIAFKHRINSALYHVNVLYNEVSKKSLEEKILRIMKNDLKNESECGIIEVPQAD